MPRRSRPQRWRTQVKEFVSYDDRNFFLPAVRYAHPLSDTKGTEVLDVIFKVHNGVESYNVEPSARTMPCCITSASKTWWCLSRSQRKVREAHACPAWR